MVFKEKEPFKNKTLVNWQDEEKLQCSFKEVIKDIQQKELLGANIQTRVKTNLTKDSSLDIEN